MHWKLFLSAKSLNVAWHSLSQQQPPLGAKGNCPACPAGCVHRLFSSYPRTIYFQNLILKNKVLVQILSSMLDSRQQLDLFTFITLSEMPKKKNLNWMFYIPFNYKINNSRILFVSQFQKRQATQRRTCNGTDIIRCFSNHLWSFSIFLSTWLSECYLKKTTFSVFPLNIVCIC